MSIWSRLFGQQETITVENPQCCANDPEDTKLLALASVIQRVHCIERALARDMQGRFFTKPVTGDAPGNLTLFHAETYYPNATEGPTYEGRITSIGHHVDTTMGGDVGITWSKHEHSNRAEVNSHGRVTVSELIGWYMVPKEEEHRIAGEITNALAAFTQQSSIEKPKKKSSRK